MKLNKLLPFFLFVLFSNFIHAQAPVKVQQFINHKDWSFVENKGQLADENGNLITDVKYYSHEGSVQVFCRPGKISFLFIKIENENGANISEATGNPVETLHATSLQKGQQPEHSK